MVMEQGEILSILSDSFLLIKEQVWHFHWIPKCQTEYPVLKGNLRVSEVYTRWQLAWRKKKINVNLHYKSFWIMFICWKKNMLIFKQQLLYFLEKGWSWMSQFLNSYLKKITMSKSQHKGNFGFLLLIRSLTALCFSARHAKPIYSQGPPKQLHQEEIQSLHTSG